ncbi:DUF4059 family protein [Streptococcus cameli]
MLQTILSLYLQSLLIAAIVVVSISLVWFLRRAFKGVDKTLQERRDVLVDLLMINVMTIPITAFGVIGILLMLRA